MISSSLSRKGAATRQIDRRKRRSAATLLRTLAHPTRLAIIRELSAGPKCVSDIRELLEVPQPNVSQHLAALRAAEIVDYHEHGKLRCYYLARPRLVRDLLEMLREEEDAVFLTPEQVLRAAAQRKDKCKPSSCG
ncbi:MAG: metalloregulator ArsR/SmtB family transcription factor [Phycisphaerales bacterium]|nr:metalloregulator ArsR/SmtB family transcription factor [Phycisphaerales bacterium]